MIELSVCPSTLQEGFAGSSGYYWSSSAHTSEVNQAYYVYFNSGALNSQYNGSRKKGQSVRLVCAAE